MILAYSSLLENHLNELDLNQIRDMAHVMSRNCRRMNGLITDLLDSARIDSGQMLPISCSPFDLAVLCEHVVQDLRDQANTQFVKAVGANAHSGNRSASGTAFPEAFKIEYPEGGVPILADPHRMEQILVNLLSNALKYSRGGAVTVHLRRGIESSPWKSR